MPSSDLQPWLVYLAMLVSCVPSQGKTILGCTCLPEWSVPQRPATVVMEPPGLGNCHGPYQGCPPTPCDGDDGGEAGLSWCYTKPPCVRPWGYCSPHGGPAAKQPGPQPGASAVSWKERHAMTISGEADVYSGGTNFTEAACKQLCTRSARCHAAVFGLPSTVQKTATSQRGYCELLVPGVVHFEWLGTVSSQCSLCFDLVWLTPGVPTAVSLCGSFIPQWGLARPEHTWECHSLSIDV